MALPDIFPLRRITESRSYHWWVFGVVAIGVSINLIDNEAISIALPSIRDDLSPGISLTTLEWITLGYGLSASAMLMLMGHLADMIGRKRVYLIGLSVFVASALVGSVSQSLSLLILMRMVQGAASAGVYAGSMALLLGAFPDSQRGKAIGFYMAAIGIGAILGAMVGEDLVSKLGWRSISFMVIPVSALAIIMAGLALRGRTARQGDGAAGPSFDWVGAALSSGALVAFSLGIADGARSGWTSAPVVVELAVALLLLLAFVLWESRCVEPMLDLSLFRDRALSCAAGAGLVSFAGCSILFLLMPFYLIEVLEWEALEGIFVLIPGALGMTVASPLSGWLSDKLGTRGPASAGMTLAATAAFAMSLLDIGSPGWHVLVWMTLFGVGMGTFVAPNISAIMGSTPSNRYGVVSGLVNLTRASANVIGISVGAMIVTAAMASQGFGSGLSEAMGGDPEGQAFVNGMSAALRLSGALMLLALVLTVIRPEPQMVKLSDPVPAEAST